MNKGFSLVELIVVIAIMAILVGVAVPTYTAYIEKANKGVDDDLVGQVVYAAKLVNVEYGVTVKLTTSDNKLVVTCEDNDGDDKAEADLAANDIAKILADAKPSAVASGSFSIALKSKNTYTQTIPAAPADSE